MKATFFLSALALVSAAVAAPTSVDATAASSSASASWGGWPWSWNQCVSQRGAEKFIKRFEGILNKQGSDLGNQVATANALLANNFVEISDSILSLEGKPLGGPSAATKQIYIDGISHAPPTNGLDTTRILVADCNKIIWQWNFKGVGSGAQEAKGFNLFTMNKHGQAEKLELEFNSIAWGIDTGYTINFPTGGHP